MPRTIACVAIVACLGVNAAAQSKHSGIPKEYWPYELAEGVTEKDVTFYSEGMPAFGRVFHPKDFDTAGKTPAVIVSHGWTGTSYSLYKYGARFAEAGLVAMVIDYRGWGESPGWVTIIDDTETTDDQRVTETDAKVRVARTRLLPWEQVQDIRSAISYIQGEPGVDPERIGLWGSSYAGGHVLTVASLDPRVDAVVSQVTGLSGNGQSEGPLPYTDDELEEAITRARTNTGGEFHTGWTTPRDVDLETRRLAKEYRPFHRVKHIPETVAVLFLLAENEELINNERAGKAAYELLKGPKKLVEYENIGHFDIYIEEHFEKAVTEATNWYREHLILK